jgi:hypothetical protein
MRTKNLYEISLDSACALDTSMVRAYDDLSKFNKIRTEMNWFLMNLTHSQQSANRGKQIHYLFVALEHLNIVEKEIRISDVDEQIIRLERILDKIRSLKQLILEYIKHLDSQD